MRRPTADEYDAGDYSGYVSQTSEGEDVLRILDEQPSQLRTLFDGLPEEKGAYAYADGKWTIKELLSHIIDGERIFAYRVLRIARGDETPIEGFDQDIYIENSHANNRSFAELLEEFDLARRSNMLMLRNLRDEDGARMGTASDKPISARTIPYIMAGHVTHHVKILKERYIG